MCTTCSPTCRTAAVGFPTSQLPTPNSPPALPFPSRPPLSITTKHNVACWHRRAGFPPVSPLPLPSDTPTELIRTLETSVPVRGLGRSLYSLRISATYPLTASGAARPHERQARAGGHGTPAAGCPHPPQGPRAHRKRQTMPSPKPQRTCPVTSATI